MDVFTDINVSEEYFHDILKRQAVVNPNILFIFRTENENGSFDEEEFIYENGITLTGSGALLGGLPERIESALRLPCHLADEPGDCVVRGTGMALENMELYGDLVYDYRKPVRYDFRR